MIVAEILRKLESVRSFVLLHVSHALLELVGLTPPVDRTSFDPRSVEVVAVDDEVEAVFLVRNELNCRGIL